MVLYVLYTMISVTSSSFKKAFYIGNLSILKNPVNPVECLFPCAHTQAVHLPLTFTFAR